jgi:hypothetical protein
LTFRGASHHSWRSNGTVDSAWRSTVATDGINGSSRVIPAINLAGGIGGHGVRWLTARVGRDSTLRQPEVQNLDVTTSLIRTYRTAADAPPFECAAIAQSDGREVPNVAGRPPADTGPLGERYD